MKISIPLKAIRSADKEDLEVLMGAYENNYRLEDIIKQKVRYEDTDRITFQLEKFGEEELTKLWSFCNKNDVDTRTMNAIQRWKTAVSDPMNSEVPSLPALANMMLQLMRSEDNKYRWLMRMSEDGYLMPYLVTSIHYSPPSKYNPENVQVVLAYGEYYSSSEYTSEEKCASQTENVYFHNTNIIERIKDIKMSESIDMSSLYDLETIDTSDDDDDSETKVKKKLTKSKKPAASGRKLRNLKLLEILAEENLFVPTEEALNNFFEHTRLCHTIAAKMGGQFTCSTKAFTKGEYRGSYLSIMHEDGRPFKLVVDMNGIPPGIDRQTHTTYAGSQLRPYHPYIRCYNLTKYSYYDVHAASLVPYQYDKKIIDNMIASPKLKNYLSSIMGGADVFKDIIAGKSGGMIVLASGAPGLGKTLTAETYSEVMEMPLYQIQSSQLGISIEKIEQNLVAALRRAERWGAVLLIDECDTYVRERGDDLIQNCIVGVFLKLLEYFSGVLFFTTNRHDIIDKAILSRCTAHIQYELPSDEQRRDILKIHSKLQGITITDADALAIAKQYKMSGRDIRNLLKNVKKFYHKEDAAKGGIKLTAKMIDPIADYIPFIKTF